MDIDTLSIIFLQQFRNPVWDAFSIFFNLLFSYITVLGVLFLVYIFYKKKNYFAILLATLSTCILTYALKEIIARPRPGLELSNLVLGASSYSFPSTHTAIAFTLAVMLSKYYPKYKISIYTIALLTAISRIYSGSHYLSDVIAGALLGIAIGYVFLIKEKELLNFEAKIHKSIKSILKI